MPQVARGGDFQVFDAGHEERANEPQEPVAGGLEAGGRRRFEIREHPPEFRPSLGVQPAAHIPEPDRPPGP